MRRLFPFLLAVLLASALTVVAAMREARSDPVVRRARLVLPDWPRGAGPITVLLASDVHLGNRAMDASRWSRIAGQVTALHPDLIVLAGDFVAGHEAVTARQIAPALTAGLRRLRAPLGVVAVLGNHDHDSDPATVVRALLAGGATPIDNRAVRRGPVVVVGVGDAYSGHADPGRALAGAAGFDAAGRGGAMLVLTHSPDAARRLPAGTAALVLAGHTHCGQVVLPLVGGPPPISLRRHKRLFDPRYRCGIVRDPGRTVVVTAGLGASVPVRLGAPPDLWLLTLGGR